MEIVNLFIGAAVGLAVGYVVKGQTSKSERLSNSGKPYSVLYDEALQELGKLKTELRSKDSEIGTLNQRIKDITRKIRNYEDKNMDEADNMADMKRALETLKKENLDLQEKMQDYKALYEASKIEIDKLKA